MLYLLFHYILVWHVCFMQICWCIKCSALFDFQSKSVLSLQTSGMIYCSCQVKYELLHNKINRMTWAPKEDSDQPGHLPSLITLHCALNRYLRAQCFFMQTVKTLIRLGRCPGWSESLLGAQIILLGLSCGGSNVLVNSCMIRKNLWEVYLKQICSTFTLQNTEKFTLNHPVNDWTWASVLFLLYWVG